MNVKSTVREFYDAPTGISGTVHGEGAQTPVVLLHSLAMTRAMWTPSIREMFGQDRQVILCDIPGHGGSPLRESRTIEAIADRIALALVNIGVDRASVVGASLGGCVAQALAIQHGTLVSGLGLVDTTSDYNDPDAWTARAATARREGFAAMADFQGSRWFTKDFREQHAEELDRLLRIFAQADVDAYEAICHAMGTVNLTPRLHEIVSPTAIVVGADDYATPVAHAEVIAANIAGASLTVIDAASHLGIIEKPREFYNALQHVL